MTYLELGSVTSGNLLVPDLIKELIDYAVDVADDEEILWDARAEEFLEDLCQAIDSRCPPFAYFGSHPGDGSDWGVWIDYDSLEQAVEDGDVAIRRDEDALTGDGLELLILYNASVLYEDGEVVWHVTGRVVNP